MTVGRNDPCPCGSGKKFKKCCWGKSPPPAAPPLAPKTKPGDLPRQSESPPAPSPRLPVPPPEPAKPLDPRAQALEAMWHEFERANYPDRVAIFQHMLDTPDLVNDEYVFEMLVQLHRKAVEAGERERFQELIAALREKQPETYQASARYYVSWMLSDALVRGEQDRAAALAREMASFAGADLDQVVRAMDQLDYHGQLAALREMSRIAWPLVQKSPDLMPWAIPDFAHRAAEYEVYDYLNQRPEPDPHDPALHERLREFVPDVDESHLAGYLDSLLGKYRTWKEGDFALQPPRKRRQRWDDDEEEREERTDPAVEALGVLVREFHGYWHRVEGISWTRGLLARQNIDRYLLRRHAGDLDDRRSMIERMANPNKKPPLSRSRREAHPLCPDPDTLDAFLAGFMSMFAHQVHQQAATAQAVPAWLRFLESRGLIDAAQREKSMRELRPVRQSLERFYERYKDDPALLPDLRARWPDEDR